MCKLLDLNTSMILMLHKIGQLEIAQKGTINMYDDTLGGV